MNEQQWLASSDAAAMVRRVTEFPDMTTFDRGRVPPLRSKVSERKFRLFAAACWRLRGALLPTGAAALHPEIAEAAEVMADGGERPRSAYFGYPVDENAVRAARAMIQPECHEGEEGRQAALLRDIVGNPFRPWMREKDFVTGKPLPGPKLNIAQEAWVTPTVVSLARAIYTGPRTDAGSFAAQDLAELSDALEEAGCDNEELLRHLRGERYLGDGYFLTGDPPTTSKDGWFPLPGPHVRGCWALDLILGKD